MQSSVRRVFPVLILALASNLAHAAPPSVNVLGFGDMSCAAWVRSKAEPELRKCQVAWVRGVLTGHNYAMQKQQVAVVSSSTVENFVDQYCREKPHADVGEAALRMSDRFSGRNEPISR